jgi:hypothetical protein
MKATGEYKARLEKLAAMRTGELFEHIRWEDEYIGYALGDVAREICKRLQKPGAAHRTDIAPGQVCEDYEMPDGSTWLQIARSLAREYKKPDFSVDLCRRCGCWIAVPPPLEDDELGTAEDKARWPTHLPIAWTRRTLVTPW